MLQAMILAAGRGERMRPLTDTLPKPLVPVRGAPLIEHHIKKLVAIGVRRIVINVSYLADVLMDTLGDGARFGCDIFYSVEDAPLESGGGVATASRYFNQGAVILLSADIFSEFDYARLFAPMQRVAAAELKAYFVLVPQTAGEPGGEFALSPEGRVTLGAPRLTLANIGVLSAAECISWPKNERFKLLAHYQAWAEAGVVSGELFTGVWRNVTSSADVDALN